MQVVKYRYDSWLCGFSAKSQVLAYVVNVLDQVIMMEITGKGRACIPGGPTKASRWLKST